MSKFGAHISTGRRDGFGQALQACHMAGSPVPLIFSLDQNVWPDIAQYSPNTRLIFRTQLGGNPNPPLWQGDPSAVAAAWYAYRKPTWSLNPAHYYAATNETDPQTLEHFDWLNAFELRLMQLADADGLKLAIGAHSTGTPSDDGGVDRYSKWARLVPSLQYAKAHGHILILHEYGFDTTLPLSSPSHALRYRSALDYLALNNADPKVAITECSDYNGYSGEGAQWLNGVCWYDDQVITDNRVIGFCGYQLGGAENWYKLIPQWRDWVVTHPTPVVVDPPPPDVDSIAVYSGIKVAAGGADDVALQAWLDERGLWYVRRVIEGEVR